MSKSRLKILIIDDTPANLQLLGQVLKNDYIVQVATSGRKGLDLAASAIPDLILLDIMMPEMDGFEVCQRLKKDKKLANIPVIFITALNDVETEVKCLSIGAVDFINKPINIELACLRINNFMERQRLRHEAIIKEQLKLAANVFNYSHDGILFSDADNNIIKSNDAFTKITGYLPDEARGKNPRFLQSGKQSNSFYEAMWKDLLKYEHWDGELCNKHKDGHLFIIHTSILIIKDAVGNVQNFLAIFSDITLRKTHEEALKKIAYFDELTGLPNRTLLTDRMDQGIQQTLRHNNVMAFCYLDIDGFKPVNDLYGHAVGDRLLQQVSERIVRCLRKIDTLSRIGGDEFVLLLLDQKSKDEYIATIKRILQATEKTFFVEGYSINISVSIGVTLFPQNDSDPDTLLRHADQAMYDAKLQGKNQYILFDEQQSREHSKDSRLLGEIKHALGNEEFVLYYQPKVNLRTRKVIGVEALIRWQHPKRGLLSPAEFLPVIENTHWMIKVSEWVVATALKQLSQWHQADIKLTVSVNIAPCDLVKGNFVEQLREHLGNYPDIEPEYLDLEILETTALNDIDNVCEIMQSCIELGVSFSLDDFGTGYSSLTYLKKLPAKTLKIDQTFIRDMLVDDEDLAIVIGTLGLAKTFHREVIAEGVETLEHGDKLLELGCDLAQGYGIARPMPADKIKDWLLQWEAYAK